MKSKKNKVIRIILLAWVLLLILAAVGSGIILLRKVRINKPPTYYTISFDSNGGSEIESIKVKAGEKIERPALEKKSDVNADYVIDGWYNGETEWIFETDTVASDLILTAHWKVVATYSKEITLSENELPIRPIF